MNQYFIGNYIQKLSIEDIKAFANSQHIKLSDYENKVLLETIQKHWKELLYGDYHAVFRSVQSKLQPQTYQVALQLYHHYRQKYQSFL